MMLGTPNRLICLPRSRQLAYSEGAQGTKARQRSDQYRQFMRKFLITVVLIACLAPSQVAHAKAGTSCPRVGATITTKSTTFVCLQVGKKRIWRKSPKKKGTSVVNLDALKVPQTIGTVRAGAGSENGPWAVRAVLRTSTDGITFSGGETIMDQAGVPNLLTTSNGTLFAYYQDWANGNIMGVAIRRPGSTTWERYKLSISGINVAPGGANGVDPSAVELSDGRIRVFWMQRLGGARIYSATSQVGAANGIVFTYDGGFAFESAAEIYDPTVVQTAAGWALWADIGGTTAYATSTNGQKFTAQPANSAFPSSAVFPWGATRVSASDIRVIASVRGPGGADGVLFRSTDGGASFTEIGRGAIPSTAGGDVGISYDPTTGIWYQLISERM